MQLCEPYDLHKTKQNERAYEECQTSPDAVYEVMPQWQLIHVINSVYIVSHFCSFVYSFLQKTLNIFLLAYTSCCE